MRDLPETILRGVDPDCEARRSVDMASLLTELPALAPLQ